MREVYESSPDECIPEFYEDPAIFASQHDEMRSLAVPEWADTVEGFLDIHRCASGSTLEGALMARQHLRERGMCGYSRVRNRLFARNDPVLISAGMQAGAGE